jgi:hypothetical protein
MSVLLQQTKQGLGEGRGSDFTADQSGKGTESFKEYFGIVTNITTDVADHVIDKYERLIQQQDTALQALFA